jgi:hypothetical protein
MRIGGAFRVLLYDGSQLLLYMSLKRFADVDLLSTDLVTHGLSFLILSTAIAAC